MWRLNDILEKVIDIDHNSRSQTAMESVWSVYRFQIVDRMRRRSS